MTWNTRDYPPVGKLLLVFRRKNKKYIVATCFDDLVRQDDDSDHGLHWVTQHGNVHNFQEDDLWMEFPAVKIEMTYDR